MRTVKQKGSWFLSPLPLIFLSLFASHCGLADRETAKKPRVTLQPTSVSSGEGIQTYKVSGDPMVVTWTVSPGYQADYTLQSCPGTGEDEVTGCIDVLSFLCLGRTVCSVVESSQGTELAQMSISQDVHLTTSDITFSGTLSTELSHILYGRYLKIRVSRVNLSDHL